MTSLNGNFGVAKFPFYFYCVGIFIDLPKLSVVFTRFHYILYFGMQLAKVFLPTVFYLLSVSFNQIIFGRITLEKFNSAISFLTGKIQ